MSAPSRSPPRLVEKGIDVARVDRVGAPQPCLQLAHGVAAQSDPHVGVFPKRRRAHSGLDARAEPKRTRKLLLSKAELSRLLGSVERQGYTLVPLDLHWKNGRAKLEVGLAKGKKQHDKRATEKDRDWQRDKARILRRG